MSARCQTQPVFYILTLFLITKLSKRQTEYILFLIKVNSKIIRKFNELGHTVLLLLVRLIFEIKEERVSFIHDFITKIITNLNFLALKKMHCQILWYHISKLL